MTKVVHILARNLEAAKNIARANKNLNVSSGDLALSYGKKDGGLKTYSFRIKKV